MLCRDLFETSNVGIRCTQTLLDMSTERHIVVTELVAEPIDNDIQGHEHAVSSRAELAKVGPQPYWTVEQVAMRDQQVSAVPGVVDRLELHRYAIDVLPYEAPKLDIVVAPDIDDLRARSGEFEQSSQSPLLHIGK